MEPLERTLRDRIKESGRGKLSIKLKTLVSAFGFAAVRQVRQSSLSSALKQLEQWGIAYRLVDGGSANDYITLWTESDADDRAHEGTTPAQPSGALVHGVEYRVLSVQPPWAWAIIFGGKDVENRSWTTPYRGRIVIHASSRKFTGVALDEGREFLRDRCKRGTAIPEEFPRSQLLGTVELVDCVENSRSPWAFPGEWLWLLRDPRPLGAPVKNVDGKLNLWKWTCP